MMGVELLSTLRGIVGAAHVLVDEDAAPYCTDWRKRFVGRALAVVRPGATDQVAAVVRACMAANTAVIPQGGNTGLVGGATPDTSGKQVVLQLGRMQSIRHVDADNLTMTVEAGCLLQRIQESAQSLGLLFPLSLAAEGSCTIGGNLATNAGGTQVLRYGNARQLCLGLEVVTPQGDVLNMLQGLRKDNTGLDLRNLYIGSEGVLGIITAATLALSPQPRGICTAVACVAGLREAVSLLSRARAHLGSTLTAFEVMNALARELVARHLPTVRQPPLDAGTAVLPWWVLLEQSDEQGLHTAQTRLEALLAESLEAGELLDAAVAQSHAESQAFWHLRESIPLAQAQEGLNIKHDISLPISKISEFVDSTDRALQASLPGSRMVTFGHLGDGNLHYNVQAPVGEEAPSFLSRAEDVAHTIVYRSVTACGGSISAEHGIGQLKRDALREHKDPVALALMRQIKAALDPTGQMNPGRIL